MHRSRTIERILERESRLDRDVFGEDRRVDLGDVASGGGGRDVFVFVPGATSAGVSGFASASGSGSSSVSVRATSFAGEGGAGAGGSVDVSGDSGAGSIATSIGPATFFDDFTFGL